MTTGQGPAKYRAGFLAALEFGVSPLASADYARARHSETHAWILGTVQKPKPKIVRHTPGGRKTRGLIVTSEDIRNHRGYVG